MRICEIGFPNGPSVQQAIKKSDEFLRLEYSSMIEFIVGDPLLYKPDLLLMFPKCNTFSIAALGKHWIKCPVGHSEEFEPKSDAARISLAMLSRFETILELWKPQYWHLENPKGLIHKFWHRGTKYSISHCQYGSERMKPTYIFSNYNWHPKPSCHRGDPCHVSAPRGSSTGTQSLKRNRRAELPIDLQRALLAIRNETQ